MLNVAEDAIPYRISIHIEWGLVAFQFFREGLTIFVKTFCKCEIQIMVDD